MSQASFGAAVNNCLGLNVDKKKERTVKYRKIISTTWPTVDNVTNYLSILFQLVELSESEESDVGMD
jgi:hypothetical protein